MLMLMIRGQNLFFIDECSDNSTCQAGGDANKVCSSGTCACDTDYHMASTGICVQGKESSINSA